MKKEKTTLPPKKWNIRYYILCIENRKQTNVEQVDKQTDRITAEPDIRSTEELRFSLYHSPFFHK